MKRQTTMSRRATLRVVLSAAPACVALAASAPTASAAVSAETRAALLAGELVIYFRHGATTWSGVDRIEWPRSRQRLLSEAGVAQSEQIGAAFRDLGAPVGAVLASPFARCRDMAEIAFGRVEERPELLGLLSDVDGRPARVAYLSEQVSTPTAGDGNRIVISHRSNIAEVAGAQLGEGDAVLMRPRGDGGFDVLETLAPDDWTRLAAGG